MKKVFQFIIGVILGIICSYFICSLISFQTHPALWISWVKYIGVFIVGLSIWIFTFGDDLP